MRSGTVREGRRDRRPIEALFHAGTFAGLTDGQLLERFTARRGEDAELAFSTLVDRHGPMVLRVCRESLRDADDADDAFQATFLVLATKAPSILRVESVGSWLFGVATRVSADARVAAARRRTYERDAPVPAGSTDFGLRGSDLGPTVREEVGRLPEPLRSAIFLHYLEGRSCEEAAHQLGWPVGTVKSRLARGRERLRRQLVRRGVDLEAGSLALGWPRATVPAAKARATVRLAMGLASGEASVLEGVGASLFVESLVKGALRAMIPSKLKIAAFATLSTAVLTVVAASLVAAASGPPTGEEPKAAAERNPGKIYLAAERGVTTLPNYSLVAFEPKAGGEIKILEGCWIRPRVSPNGRTVAFWGGDALWTRSVSGGDEPRKILEVGAAGGSPPVWSPDGSRIVVSLAEQAGAPLAFRTVEIGADGSGVKDLKLPPENQVHDWSPDGQWLLTTSSRDAGGWRLELASLDGGERLGVSDKAGLYYPRFSPDGRRILCTEKDGIWVMDLHGANRRRVFEAERSGASACWSPDGTRIAVVVNGRKAGQAGEGEGRIELVGLDGARGATFRPAGGLTVDMPDWR